MNPPAEVLVGVIIAVGLVGIVLPLLPGAWLVLVAVLAWATEVQSLEGWIVLAISVGAIGLTQVVKYTMPERRLRQAGVARSSMMVGGVAGVVGFFVVPVLGLPIGFVLGIYAAERRRLSDRRSARASTRAALRAVGLSLLVEIAGASTAAGAWLLAVLTG